MMGDMAHDPERSLAPRTAEDLRRQEEVGPPWCADLRRAVLCGLGTAVFATVLILLAKTGALQTQNRSRVDLDVTWAGIILAIFGALWPYLLISTTRDDAGYRHRGLAGVLAIAVPAAGLLDVVAVGVWSLLVDTRIPSDGVLATVLTDHVSLLTVAALSTTVHAWSTACVIGFIRPSPVRLAVALPGWLLVGGLCVWRTIAGLEQPPSVPGLLAWGVLALLGLVVMALVAVVDEARYDKTPAA